MGLFVFNMALDVKDGVALDLSTALLVIQLKLNESLN